MQTDPVLEITKTFRFEAAHYLPNVPKGHQCGKMHGHSYVVDVALGGSPDPIYGWVIDYSELSKVFEPYRRLMDHMVLNEIEGLENPTSELLAIWLFKRLSEESIGSEGRKLKDYLRSVTIHETCTSKATFANQWINR